ncbi:MAG: hypothetical protein HN478_11775 [Rhodospirillaceae bacterium]|jgi:hypothetical protein|nr:hypothetical protein [Rhodospirillaceae bacterium]MBT4489292.1 hypothetical protein [Rhodospirillaceae bacterium]MBT5194744.1 hypothetical protein [Rhodospirillaceae bacterium]MBT6430828.1 hypothetical protein [Rhodospirillaceae bacterium]MBT7758786.1 hypothetical protein [Rhodospirillaceae bacterium]
MTIYRYAARAGILDRDTLFPGVMVGLLALWALIAVAISCGPKLAAVEDESQAAKAFVSCEPTEDRAPGQLLRCVVEADTIKLRDI